MQFLVHDNATEIENLTCTVLGCTEARITTTNPDPGETDKMVMCYRFTNADNTTMDFGWVDTASGNEEYFLEMAKR